MSEVMGAEEIAGIFSAVALRSPVTLALPSRPRPEDLARGIRELTNRRVQNRIVRADRAISLLEDLDRIIEENLTTEWGDHRGSILGPGNREHPMEPERAVAALDRALRRVLDYEQTWEQSGRSPDALWRRPWDTTGKELAEDLAYLRDLREFLQVARTLLHE